MESEDIRRRAEGRCPICGTLADRVGVKTGRWRRRDYHLARCSQCAFSFVTDPDVDFAAIYNADYYRGEGADPMVRYEDEVNSPADSARAYELRGLVGYAASAIAASATGVIGASSTGAPANGASVIGASSNGVSSTGAPASGVSGIRASAIGASAIGASPNSPSGSGMRGVERWLDFGSGLGGFVTYLRSLGIEAYGYDEGYAAGEARGKGVPMLDKADLDQAGGTFGIVSAIEVLEHVLNPVETVRQISGLLRPGGLFLYTTGNAAPFRSRLPQWSYVVPEIHVSFYEPETMKTIFRQAELVPLEPAPHSAIRDIIRYKIMKTLGIKRRSMLDRILPWPALTYLADNRFKVSAMVLGVKAPDHEPGKTMSSKI